MNIGENIKRFRKEKGLTQKELGERLNMTQSAIGQFENNTTSPKLETVEKIASALGTTAFALMGAEYFDLKNLHLAEEAAELERFTDFLKSIGYSVEFVPKGEEGETYAAELVKDGSLTEYTEEEFKQFRGEIIKSVDYQVWQKSQGKK